MTKTRLITGAGRGMGVEFARAALAAGHKVVATGRNPDTVRSAVGEHAEATSTFAAASVHFPRRADRVAPHAQTIFVTEVVGLCQREGGPIVTIRPGDRMNRS